MSQSPSAASAHRHTHISKLTFSSLPPHVYWRHLRDIQLTSPRLIMDFYTIHISIDLLGARFLSNPWLALFNAHTL